MASELIYGRTVSVRIPATTANCGPGFDALGIACTLYNEMELTFLNQVELTISVEGQGAGFIPRDERNIAFQAARRVAARTGSLPRGMQIRMRNLIPLARGLGSSAAAIVGAVVAANELSGRPFDQPGLLTLATEIEGHPDNVAPALFGGVTASIQTSAGVQCLRFDAPENLSMVVAIPDFTLSTQAARRVIPRTVPFADAVFNVSRAAMVVGALATGRLECLRGALDDRLHQPYRERLIPGMDAVFRAALGQGALGAAISGAGPALMAYTAGNEHAVGRAMCEAFRASGSEARFEVLKADRAGATILSS